MLFCPFLQKFGSLEAVNQTFLKSLYCELANPRPFNHSSEVMFSGPLILGFLQLTQTFPPILFLSVFLYKVKQRGEKGQAECTLLHCPPQESFRVSGVAGMLLFMLSFTLCFFMHGFG